MQERDKSLDTGSSTGPLVAFYLGKQPDSKGRMIHQIQEWDDDRLEEVHDYVQWLFPTRNRSQYNPGAPILDDVQIEEFRQNDRLKSEMIKSFSRMMRFYGLELSEDPDSITVGQGSNWTERKSNWLSIGNHNFLRITRILTSLRLLGLNEYAHAFLKALVGIYDSGSEEMIGQKTLGFWRSAAGRG